MSAVKTLALGAMLLTAANLPARGGALSQYELTWTAWTPKGVIETPASTASLFGLGVSSNVSTTPPAIVAAAPAPAPVAAPVVPAAAPVANAPTLATAPMVAAVPVPAAIPPAPATYDAFVNLGPGSYPDSANLTTGGAQAWFMSPAVAHLFGGTISPQQAVSFDAAVLQHVQQTFNLAGVPITLTDNPNAPAAHTLSVVSGTTSAWGPVLGLTNIGGNGFDFVEQAAKVSQSVDQLEWVVAHNVSHELMLAFGVPENYDQTGNYVDARNANLAMMIDPNATFSQSAAQALLAQNFLNSSQFQGLGPQYVGAQAVVPEPATIAAWTVVLAGLAVARSRRARAAA